MQVPNSIIHIKCADDRGYGPLIVPSYFEKILRRVFQGRLDPQAPGGGIDVQPYPENGNNDTRYREVNSISEERDRLRSMYKVDKHGYIADVLNDEELKFAIEKLMLAEAKRLTERAKPLPMVTPHVSFTNIGLSNDQAVALQTAGYANRDLCVGANIMDLNAIPLITLDIALKLITEELKVEEKKVAAKAE